jgi:hypothetical protein
VRGHQSAAFVLALLVAFFGVLVVLPVAGFIALAKCDESCGQDPDRGWVDDPNAFQWDVLVAAAVAAALCAVLLPFLVGAKSRRGAWIAAVGIIAAACVWLGIVFGSFTNWSGGNYASFALIVSTLPVGALLSAWLTPPPSKVTSRSADIQG